MPAVVGVHISGELPGAIKDYGSATLPFGFLICDGSALSRTAYAKLFSYIGISYGNGDGSTTFNLPDCRGYFTRGIDNGAGNDPDAATRYAINGGNTGDMIGSYEAHSFENHGHEFTQWTESGQFQGGGPAIGPLTSTQFTTGAYDGNPGTETRPLNVYVNKMIAYV